MEGPAGTTPTTIIVAALLVLAGLAYLVSSVLSPFVLLAALGFLLFPYRHEPVAKRLLSTGLLLFSFWFLVSLLGLLVPFLVALFLAYLLNPLVLMAERKGMRRWLASLLAVLGIVGVALCVVFFLVPPAIVQFESVIAGAAGIAGDIMQFFRDEERLAFLARYGIAPDQVQSLLSEQVSPRLESLLRGFFEAMLGLVTGISTVLLQLANIVLVPFLLFYLLKDLQIIREKLLSVVPSLRRERIDRLLIWADRLLGRYFRGALFVAVIQGTVAGVALSLIGVQYALVLGIMTGIMDFIPYLGLVISLLVSSIVALLSGGAVLAKVIAVVVLYLLQKLLEATVLAPKIIGAEVGLHPVVLILCLLVFGHFMGFIGLLIAVPTSALLISATEIWLDRRNQIGTS